MNTPHSSTVKRIVVIGECPNLHAYEGVVVLQCVCPEDICSLCMDVSEATPDILLVQRDILPAAYYPDILGIVFSRSIQYIS
jgi:hypothetical protein